MVHMPEAQETFTPQDHQGAYIFDPAEHANYQQRHSKRRRMLKQSKGVPLEDTPLNSTLFVPLLNGTEEPAFVHLRDSLFRETWARIDARIQNALRESNKSTLDQVASFVTSAQGESLDKIPSGFLITGPNIASQSLLFEQLSEFLQCSPKTRFVSLRSTETPNIKAALKKIIRDVTGASDSSSPNETRKGYLDYDLEAVHEFIKNHKCNRIFVAFEDSEGFDSGLLSDLITLLNSWRPQIPFNLLFGVATSVDLLQARLLKSVCQQIYGAQFDAVQTSSILETIFKMAVAAYDVPLRIGWPLLRIMLKRQYDQVAGIQAFVSSLKYSYMCHFYANALSILSLLPPGVATGLQAEHLSAVRNLPSFRTYVERAVERGDLEQSRSLLVDDASLIDKIQASEKKRQKWVGMLLRSLLIQEAAGALDCTFHFAYVDALNVGVSVLAASKLINCIRHMNSSSLTKFLRRILSVFRDGERTLNLGAVQDDKDVALLGLLDDLLDRLEKVSFAASGLNLTLRSAYDGQAMIVRTTVIAHRVQLSRDSATLSDKDRVYTQVIDDLTEMLSAHIAVPAATMVLFSEFWTYDSRSPSYGVFLPQPRAVFERSLVHPPDYLPCICCEKDSGGIQATLPATSILYQLYLETGNLINVADLWTAFQAYIKDEDKGERDALFEFYRGLAELRALGFLKASKKKVDHVSKLKWL